MRRICSGCHYPLEGLVGGPSDATSDPASDASSVRLRWESEQGSVSLGQCKELPMQKTSSSSGTEEQKTKMGERTEGVRVCRRADGEGGEKQ